MPILSQVCRASKVAARIRVDRVPVHPRLRASFKDDPLGLAIYAAIAGYVIVGLNMDVMNFRWLWLLFALAATWAGLMDQDIRCSEPDTS